MGLALRGATEVFLRGQSDFDFLDPTECFPFPMMIFEVCSVWGTHQQHSDDGA